jgi:hypothetical protein
LADQINAALEKARSKAAVLPGMASKSRASGTKRL